MKQIVQDGVEVLRETAKPLPEKLFGSAELAKLIKDMAAALDKELEGVALAAPQVGVSYRLFIVRKDRTVPLNAAPGAASGELPAQPEVLAPQIEVYINPEIVKISRKKQKVEEGCLSVRWLYGVVERHEKITITAWDEKGRKQTIGASGLLSQIFQHEIDHLDGILFTDKAENVRDLPPLENKDAEN